MACMGVLTKLILLSTLYWCLSSQGLENVCILNKQRYFWSIPAGLCYWLFVFIKGPSHCRKEIDNSCNCVRKHGLYIYWFISLFLWCWRWNPGCAHARRMLSLSYTYIPQWVIFILFILVSLWRHYTVPVGLRLSILPQPPKCWGYRYAPPHSAGLH